MAVSKGAEEARNHLPELLDAAEKGRSTIITKRGRAVAGLAPIAIYSAAIRQHPLTPLAGSGRGLWGPDSAQNSARVARRMEPLNLEGLPDDPLLLVDTAPIIYTLESHPTLGPYFRPMFDAHAAGKLRFAVTTITIAEVLTGPFKRATMNSHRRYRAILKSWRTIALDTEIAESAARLRASCRLKLADAVQAASALAINADALVTHDRDFSRVRWLHIIS